MPLGTTVAVSEESLFQNACSKNQMINNVDKLSIILKQRLHIF